MRLVLYVALSYAFALVKGINQFKDPRHPFTTISTNTPNYTVRWTCEDCAQQPIDLKVYYTKFSDGWQEVHLLDDLIYPDSEYVWDTSTFRHLIQVKFHFTLFHGGDAFNSADLYFVEQGERTDLSTPVPTNTAASSTSPSATSSVPVPTHNTTQSGRPEPARAPGNGNKTSKVGLGVGIGLGVPVLFVIGGYAGYIFFRWHHKRGHQKEAMDHRKGEEELYSGPSACVELSMPTYKAELGGDGPHHELPPHIER